MFLARQKDAAEADSNRKEEAKAQADKKLKEKQKKKPLIQELNWVIKINTDNTLPNQIWFLNS